MVHIRFMQRGLGCSWIQCFRATSAGMPSIQWRSSSFIAEGRATNTLGVALQDSIERKTQHSSQSQRCRGCGAPLQTRSPGKLGYIDGAVLQRATAAAQLSKAAETKGAAAQPAPVVCARCFAMKHYGRVDPVQADVSGMVEHIRSVPRSRAMAMLVVDAMDIEGTIVRNLPAVLGHGRDVLVVVNKCDLLPPGTSFARLNDWVRSRLRELGIRVGRPARDADTHSPAQPNAEEPTGGPPEKSWHARRAAAAAAEATAPPDSTDGQEGWEADNGGTPGTPGTKPRGWEEVSIWDVLFCSARTGDGARDVARWLQSRRFGRDVFVVGSVNVGKSTLINRVSATAWEDATRTAGFAGPPGKAEHGKFSASADREAWQKSESPVSFELDDVPEPGEHRGPGGRMAGSEALQLREEAAAAARAAEEEDVGAPVARHLVADASGRRGAGTSRGPAWVHQQAGGGDIARLERRSAGGQDTAGTEVKKAEGLPPVSAAQRLGSSELTHGSMRWAMPWARLAMPVPLTTSAAPGTTLGMVTVGLPASDSGKKGAVPGAQAGKRPHKDGRLIDCPGVGDDTPRVRLLRSIALGQPRVDQLGNTERWLRRQRDGATAPNGSLKDGVTGTVGPGAGAVGEESEVEALLSDMGAVDSDLGDHTDTVTSGPSDVPTGPPALLGPTEARRLLVQQVPAKRLRPRHFRVSAGRSLFLGGMTRLDVRHSGDFSVLVTVYGGMPVHIGRTEAADALFDRQVMGVLGGGKAGNGGDAAAAGAKMTRPKPSTKPQPNGGKKATAAAGSDDWWSQYDELEDSLDEDAESATETETEGGEGSEWVAYTEEVEEGAPTDGTAAAAPETLSGTPDKGQTTDAGPTLGPSDLLLVPSAGPLRHLRTVNPSELDRRLQAALRGDEEAERLLQGNPGRVRARRQRRQRRALFDVSVAGLGWASVTPVEIEGTTLWRRAVSDLRVDVLAGEEARVHVRPPMLPFEASGTRPEDWATSGDALQMASRLFHKTQSKKEKKLAKREGKKGKDGERKGGQHKGKRGGKRQGTLPPWAKAKKKMQGDASGRGQRRRQAVDDFDSWGWEAGGSRQ